MSHFHLSPHRITVLAVYALVIGFLGEAPLALLREVVAAFIPLSLAASPSASARWLQCLSWLSEAISLALCCVIVGGFKCCSALCWPLICFRATQHIRGGGSYNTKHELSLLLNDFFWGKHLAFLPFNCNTHCPTSFALQEEVPVSAGAQGNHAVAFMRCFSYKWGIMPFSSWGGQMSDLLFSLWLLSD